MVLHVKPVEVAENMMEVLDIKDGREPLTTENLGFIVVVVVDDDDDFDDWERQEIKNMRKRLGTL